MKKYRGASNVIVTVISVVVLAAVLLFFWQVFSYYRAIRAGEAPELPQFRTNLSFLPQGSDAQVDTHVDRARLETADDPFLGAENAELVIVEFVDYECPFCKEASGTVRRMASRYGDRVRVIVRDYPVAELHPNAMRVAEAVGCAEAQGAFWQMHDRVFAENARLDQEKLEILAQQSGVDLAVYRACMGGDGRLEEIEEDMAAGKAAGVRGTPTFFFNGQRVEGAIPAAMFDALIESFLNPA